MAGAIRSVFFTPPVAVARLGGSATPVDAYVWREDPSLHGGGLTALAPAVSLRVEEDGSVTPYRPTELVFRDGDRLRPVAPFLELWVEAPDGAVGPLTGTLLAEAGGSLADVSYTVQAANRKAERRTLDASCGFSATVQFDHAGFAPVELLASSPGPAPLVSPDRPVPLGHIQPLRPEPDPPGQQPLRDVLRLRFTPAKGQVYGPPSAVEGEGGPDVRVEIVPPANRILNEGTAWTSYSLSLPLPHPQPADTYDGSGDPLSPDDRSWGVVDDTCDLVITATVRIGGDTHVAHARVFVGPPDYAPDKRPFYSLLDDLLDREAPDQEFNPRRAEVEVADLLRRAFETVSLNNVDTQRRRGILENASRANDAMEAAAGLGTLGSLRARLGFDTRREEPPLLNRESMTNDDRGYRAADRNQIKTDTAFPYAALAADAHAALTDLPRLLEFLAEDADRVRRLVRPPYALVRESAPEEPRPPAGRRRPWDPDAALHDMRMPAFMRDSDASPLSISRRQYVQLMSLVDHLAAARRELVGLEAEPALVVGPVQLFDAFQRTDLTRDIPEVPREERP